ncbi:MAG: malonyl-CoA decarboxylase domain-containing protein [Terriglobales bacterium]
MPQFLDNLWRGLRGGRGAVMPLLCRQLVSQRGEASQTVLAEKFIEAYDAMEAEQRLKFFQMLCREFGPDEAALRGAASEYLKNPDTARMLALSNAVDSPRRELLRRVNTASRGTATLVTMRSHLLPLLPAHAELKALDADLKYLFKSWFNRGFLRLERISWQTSAIVLEKLMRYESVHEINGWPDLRRRLEADRRCFAYFHPALVHDPIIFMEAALTRGLKNDLDSLLDINAPVLPAEEADTAVFYSINNCLEGLRGIPFGNFLVKHVVDELNAELPNIRSYTTLSPLPRFAKALRDEHNERGFTRERLSRLLADHAPRLVSEAGRFDAVDAFFFLLQDPVRHREILAEPLQRLALVYLTQVRLDGRLYDPVGNFHFANGARLEWISTFANLRPYGLKESFGVMANYRYLPEEVEENHEAYIVKGEVRLASRLLRGYRTVTQLWNGDGKKASPAERHRE